MMGHWIVAPVVLPSLLAPLMMLAARGDLPRQRALSLAGAALMVAIAVALVRAAAAGGPESYALGNWPAPFGIVLVLDRLSAMMVLTTTLLALAVLVYVIGSGWDARGRAFHPLFHFLLMGVCGAFLTGDLFNLFVFFEVLLIASYGLMLHGGGARRMRAGVQYVVTNLAGSTLFLFAVGAIYAVTGTLNMADLALRAAETGPQDAGLLRVGGLILLAVFAIKAALVPLHFWLPHAYGEAPAPVAAMFAIMTKVGAYAIIRVYTLIFGAEAGEAAWLAADWLIPAALVTMALGAAGMLGARALGALACFSVIASMGTLLVAVGAFSEAATAAALYYMLHSTFAGAAMFLIVELIADRRGGRRDRLELGAPPAQGELMAGLFFLTAIAVAGMPPLSGFLGKLLVLDGVRGDGSVWTIWAVVLASSLAMVVAFARAGSTVFWKAAEAGEPPPPGRRPAGPVAAAGALLAAMVAMTIWAGPVTRYLDGAAAQLHAPQGYIEAVLGPAGHARAALDAR